MWGEQGDEEATQHRNRSPTSKEAALNRHRHQVCNNRGELEREKDAVARTGVGRVLRLANNKVGVHNWSLFESSSSASELVLLLGRRPLLLVSSFHSTPQNRTKVDLDFYERIAQGTTAPAKKKKAASIYNVHQQPPPQGRPDVRGSFVTPSAPPKKNRKDWDNGDFKRERLVRQQQPFQQFPSPDDRRRGPHPPPRGTTTTSRRPEAARDAEGRRFRRQPPAASSSSWDDRFASSAGGRRIPRNGEVDEAPVFRRNSNRYQPQQQPQAHRQHGQHGVRGGGGGGELFSQYTRPPPPSSKKRQQYPARQQGRGGSGGKSSTSDSDELERMLQSTPVILGDDYDENEFEEAPTKKVKGPATLLPKTSDQSRFPPEKLSAYISCQDGLEAFLKEELDMLGIAHKMHKNYGAHLSHPSVEDLMRCHLFLGTASNIFLRCGDPFTARALGELSRKVQAMPWKNILDFDDVDQPPKFKVKVKSSKSRLLHTTAIRDHLLSGIYASLGFAAHAQKQKDLKKNSKNEKQASRDDNDDDEEEEDDGTAVRLTIHFFRDKAQIAIDTSATPLHRRAYRLASGKAPLREDLAFAFLFSAGWRPVYALSDKKQQLVSQPKFTSVIDPFCGSGTLAIEAAAMASGLPPGRLRPAPLAGTTLYDPEGWEKLVMQAMQRSAAIDSSAIKVCASDRDRGAVESTKSNAQRAGVLGLIETQDCAFSKHPWLEKPADAPENLLLVGNLPFGRRLKVPLHKRNHKKNPLLPLYQSIATHLDSFGDSGKELTAMFLSDEPVLFGVAGCAQKFDTAFSTKHGGIQVSGVLVKPAANASPKGTKGKQAKEEEEEVDNEVPLVS